MLARYKELHECKMHYIAQWQAPFLTIALDIDAPGRNYRDGHLRDTMIERVTALADDLSKMFDLGRWWAYDTGSPGVHIIFEKPMRDRIRWSDCMGVAAYREGWHECEGHLTECRREAGCVLRVGHKPGRAWDIVPWASNPVNNVPPHVQEHDALLAKRLPAERR